jgi:hypothetical protein
MSARVVGASVTHDRVLDTCEPSYVPGATRPFFIPVVHSPLGVVGMWQHRSSPLGEARPGPRASVRAHLDREARSGAEEYMAAPDVSSQGGRARSHGTCVSAGAHLDREVRSRAEERVAAPELNSARRRGPGPRGSNGAHLSKEVRSVGVRHMAALKPTSAGMCGLKIQLM